MKTFTFIFPFLFSVTSFAQLDAQTFCAKEGPGDYGISKEHKLKNGTTLFVCAMEKNSILHEASLWIVKPNQKPKRSEITISSTAEGFGYFGLNPVKIDFTPTGMTVTDYIPLDETDKNFIPSVRRTIICKDDCIEQKKLTCAFKLQKKDKTKAKEEELILKKARSKDGIPLDEEIMVLYRGALSGNKEAAKTLRSEKFVIKMDKALEGEVGDGPAHQCIKSALNQLHKAGCF